MPEQLSFEAVISRLVELREQEQEARWEMGDLLLQAQAVFPGRGFARAVASELGCSTRWVRLLMSVARAFPQDLRAADLTWEHHRIAASTTDPLAWLDRAVAEGWSTRQLADEIKRSRAGEPERDEMLAAGDTLVRRVDEYFARWGPRAEAVLRRVRLRLAAWEEAWAQGLARPP